MEKPALWCEMASVQDFSSAFGGLDSQKTEGEEKVKDTIGAEEGKMWNSFVFPAKKERERDGGESRLTRWG